MSELHAAKELLSGCLFVPVDKIDDDAVLHDLKEMDSLSFATLVLQLEQSVGREIDVMEILDLRSVRDVAALLGKAT